MPACKEPIFNLYLRLPVIALGFFLTFTGVVQAEPGGDAASPKSSLEKQNQLGPTDDPLHANPQPDESENRQALQKKTKEKPLANLGSGSGLSYDFLMARDQDDWGFLREELKEIRVGVLAHAFGPFARGKEYGSAYNLEFRFRQPDWNFWHYLWSPRIGLGGTMNPSELTDQIYLVFIWRFNFSRNWFFDFEGGFAHHNGELVTLEANRRQFGYATLFRLSGAVGYRLTERISIGLSLDHISNGYTHRRNEGLDQFGIVMGFAY